MPSRSYSAINKVVEKQVAQGVERPDPTLSHLRRFIQIAVVLLAAVAGFRLATGRSMDGVELFCPFGGLESAYSLFGQQRFTCATGAGNLAILIAVLGLTLFARRVFCSWVCPVGTVAEWMARLGARVSRWLKFRRNRFALGLYEPPAQVDRVLRWLRLPILLIILFFTYKTGELVFRAYDPYYVLFSMNGHDVKPFSYALLAGVLVLGVVIPMAWCRYLCPLGIVLAPFSRIGWLRLRRIDSACSGCGKCETVCPQSIPLAGKDEVHSGECTLCLECTSACPRPSALSIQGPNLGDRLLPKRIPAVALPVLIVLFAVLGIGGARHVRIPSVVHDYDTAQLMPVDGPLSMVRMTVDGVKCVDSAQRAARQLEELEGVHQFKAYAAQHEVEVLFDGTRVDPGGIRSAFEGPYYDAANNRFLFHLFKVVETH